MYVPEESQIRQAYTAFNARDVDAILELMQPDVHWPKGFEGGFVQGHDAVREYWLRQWAEIDPNVAPTRIRVRENGQVEVTVHQTVRDLHGEVIMDGDVRHIYSFRDGKIAGMSIETEA